MVRLQNQLEIIREGEEPRHVGQRRFRPICKNCIDAQRGTVSGTRGSQRRPIKSRARCSVQNGLMWNCLDIVAVRRMTGGPTSPYQDSSRSQIGPTGLAAAQCHLSSPEDWRCEAPSPPADGCCDDSSEQSKTSISARRTRLSRVWRISQSLTSLASARTRRCESGTAGGS